MGDEEFMELRMGFIKKILFAFLILCFLNVGFLEADASFYDFTQDFYDSLHDEEERIIFKNFEKYIQENPNSKGWCVKKEFFKILNDSKIKNKVKNLGEKNFFHYAIDFAILKVFGEISIDNPESVKMASISLNTSVAEMKEYMGEHDTFGISFFIK